MPVRRLIFTVALRRALNVAHRRGDITDEECAFMKEVIENPRRIVRGKRINLLQEAHKKAVGMLYESQGEAPFRATAIDWEHWFDLLVEWLPVILKTLMLLLAFLDDNNGGAEKPI